MNEEKKPRRDWQRTRKRAQLKEGKGREEEKKMKNKKNKNNKKTNNPKESKEEGI